ncbi:MAG: hypothetical protein FNT29_07330 [Halothiobacillaceae bacterium]|nr:MAG: hypothetical protein FNT29_07330 [Halothiobacillaceae bacterium]
MDGFSIFEYLYRDASNYKAWGSLLLKGQVTQADADALGKFLEGGEFFIAEQVGVPPVYAELWEISGGVTEDDHVWHEFVGLRPATAEDIQEKPWGSVSELLARFTSVRQWDERLSPNWDI